MIDSVVPVYAEVIDLEEDKPKQRLVERYTKITKSKCELMELRKNANFNKEPHELFVANVAEVVKHNLLDRPS